MQTIFRGRFTHPSLSGMTVTDLAFLKRAHEAVGSSFDPRIHFALSCGAVSCPPLASQPMAGETLDEQLNDAVGRVLDSGMRGLNSDGVSAYFHWFSEDFRHVGGVAAFIGHYRPDSTTNLERSLDFNLNFNRTSWGASGSI